MPASFINEGFQYWYWVFSLKLRFLPYDVKLKTYMKIFLGASTACYEKRGNSNQEKKT